jgi:lipopolysaccharide transport system permease protein
VDFAISFCVLLGMMIYFGTAFSWQLALVPLFLLGTFLTAVGVGTLLSALTVSYRDFRAIVPFLVQFWMYLTPVIYPASIVPREWRWILAANPMDGLIEGFRGAFLGRPLDWPHIVVSLLVAVCLFVGGAAFFRSVERRFADVI